MPVDRHCFGSFPTLDGTDTVPQVSGDLLPGVQALLVGDLDRASLELGQEFFPTLSAVHIAWPHLRTSGADIVVASRHVRGGGVSDWSLARRFISWTATLLATFILPGTLGEVRDPMSGFFVLRRPVLDGVVLNPIGYKILLDVLAKGDYTRI